MSMNPQALEKLLIEMDNQLNKSKAELSMCDLQLDRVNQNLNIITSTTKTLKSVCRDSEPVWKGIGRSFVQTDVDKYLKQLTKDEGEFRDSKKSLLTKKNYLETTLDKTIENMQRIVKPNEP